MDIQADVQSSTEYIGGFIGHANTKNTVRIENSVFSGSITKTGTAAYYIGGFVGWSQNCTVTIDTCAFTGSYSNTGSFNSVGFACKDLGRITINNFYSNSVDKYNYTYNSSKRLYVPSSGYPTAVALVDTGSARTFYGTFEDALSAWAGDTTLMLLTDATTASTISVSGTKTLDLNGCGLQKSGSGRVINVAAGATLNLTDSGSAIHKYTIASPRANGAGLAVVNDAASGDSVKTFAGGYITGGSVNDNGGAILVSGTLNMDSGTIIGNQVSISRYNTGGAVYVSGGGRFSMTGGAIIGNYAKFGGGIGSSMPSSNGATVVSLSGGSIAYNLATDTAGGIHGNGNNGSASKGIDLTISGTTSIVNNHTDGKWATYAYAGGGVLIDGAGHMLTLSGSPTIEGNTAGEGTASHPVVDNDVCFTNRGNPKAIIGELSNTVPIGVTMQTPGVFTNSTTTANNDTSKFESDVADVKVGKNAAGQLLLGVPCAVTYDANGATHGSAPTDGNSPYAKGSSVSALSKGSLARDGHAFAGWKIGTAESVYANSADTITGATESFTISGDTTLTAQWDVIPTVAVIEKHHAFDGTEKPLLVVDETKLVGGTIQYALGADATTIPSEGWGASIPTATDAGIYYVWYKVAGDEGYADIAPTRVVATITRTATSLAVKVLSGEQGLVYSAAKDQTLAPNVAASGAVGALNFSNASPGAAGKLVVDASTGAVTVPRGTKAGTYVVIVRAEAVGASGSVESKMACFRVVVAPKPLSEATIASVPAQTYEGSPLKPKPTVRLDGTTLVAGTDYVCRYRDNTKAGTGTVIVTGRGNYGGSASRTFRIVKK